MLGPESRDRKGRSRNLVVMSPGGRFPPDEPASGGRSDYRAQAPLRDGIGMMQTGRQASALGRSRYDPEPIPPNRCAGGSNAADPLPGAGSVRIRSGSRDRKTV